MEIVVYPCGQDTIASPVRFVFLEAGKNLAFDDFYFVMVESFNK